MDNEEAILEELRKIRKALEPAPPEAKPKNFLEEFKKFLENYKVMGLAVAFIMGIYLGRLVQAIVTAFISPVLTLIFVLMGFVSEATVLANPADYPQFFNPVLFLSEFITFIIVAFVVFMLVKFTKRLGIK